MTGMSSWGLTSMIWFNFKQFALSGKYTKINFSKNGKLKWVHNINLTSVYSYGNIIGFVGYSGILNAGKWGVTGFNTSAAMTLITGEEKNTFISPSITAFYTRPFTTGKRFTISPELYIISTPLIYSTKEKVTTTDRTFSAFIGSGFDYQLTRRFKFNMNYKANMVEAARPAFYTAPRLEFTKAKYLEASIRSKVFGDDASRQYVLAADDTTSNNSGLVPTRQLTEIVNPLSNADRPLISAISSGVLPDAGMTFEIPKITAVPTVAVEAEAAEIDETGMTNSYISVDVKKFAGGQTFSVELLDRSSPAFFDELVRQMEFAYAKATDSYVGTTIQGAGTLNANAQANTASGLVAYVSSAAAAVYSASLGFARNLVVTPEQWGNIMGYAESSGRPIYTASQPQNAGGAVSPQSLRGNVLGLDLYVARTFTGSGGDGTADYSMVVINPESYTWYESSRFRLETNVVSNGKLNGQIKVAYYGYGALATKVAAGANWFNKS